MVVPQSAVEPNFSNLRNRPPTTQRRPTTQSELMNIRDGYSCGDHRGQLSVDQGSGDPRAAGKQRSPAEIDNGIHQQPGHAEQLQHRGCGWRLPTTAMCSWAGRTMATVWTIWERSGLVGSSRPIDHTDYPDHLVPGRLRRPGAQHNSSPISGGRQRDHVSPPEPDQGEPVRQRPGDGATSYDLGLEVTNSRHSMRWRLIQPCDCWRTTGRGKDCGGPHATLRANPGRHPDRGLGLSRERERGDRGRKPAAGRPGGSLWRYTAAASHRIPDCGSNGNEVSEVALASEQPVQTVMWHGVGVTETGSRSGSRKPAKRRFGCSTMRARPSPATSTSRL